MTLTAILFFLLFLFVLLYPFYVVHKHTLGHHEPIIRTPNEWGAEYEDIAYETDDGIVLKGWWIKASSRKAVLLMHGKSGSRNGYHSGIFDLARYYHEKDWNVMMVDLRAHGESGGERVTFGLKEHADMLGWIDSLGKESAYRWRIHGFSMGAATALMMAQKSPGSFERVIADAPWIDFEYLAKQELWRRASLPPFLYGYVKWIAKRFFGQDFDFVDNRRRCEELCEKDILYIFEEEDALLGRWHKDLLKNICPSVRITWFEGVGHVEAFKTHPHEYIKMLF